MLIADFDNRANDPVFNGSIEQALAVGVEGASFITTYPRRDAIRSGAAIRGRRQARREDRQPHLGEGGRQVRRVRVDRRERIRVHHHREPDRPGGEQDAEDRAGVGPDEGRGLCRRVGTLAARIRRELGDTTTANAERSANETFTTASLDAVRDYTIAQDLQTNSKDDEAILYYKRAVDADPNFGRAYAGWANSLFQLGRKTEAEELWKKALSLMDRMSDRERYRTLGGYYLGIARNYEQAIGNYSDLVKAYPADRAGHSNLALAYFYRLDFPNALVEGRKAVEIYPTSFKFRSNYTLYAMYASQFDTAANEAQQLLAKNANFADAYFPKAISELVAGNRDGCQPDLSSGCRRSTNPARRAPRWALPTLRCTKGGTPMPCRS